LRTPFLPFDDFAAWNDRLEAPKALAEPEHLGSALAADRRRLRERLRRLLDRAEVREAVFLASPDLDQGLEYWYREPDCERGGRAERALVRYFSRMAGRATPFGLFAGTSTGSIGQRTCLELDASRSYRRHTRLDMDYVFALTEALAADPSVRGSLLYAPNSSLYRAGGRVRYVEARLKDRLRSYHLVAVDDTPLLRAALDFAEGGIRPRDLAAALATAEITVERLETYVGQLIDNQILLPDLAPLVTGPEPIHPLIIQLQAHPQTAEVVHTLGQVRDELAALDRAGPGVEPGRYRTVAGSLEALPVKVELQRLFQVDLVKPAPAATLGEEVLAEVRRGIEILHRITRQRRESELTRFAAAFAARYEEREVPLVVALDEESGISFGQGDGPGADPSPLLNGVAFPGEQNELTAWGAPERHLLRKLTEALKNGAEEIVLEEADLEALSPGNPPPLPDALSVIATVAAASPEALAAGEFRLLFVGAFGPSGAPLLGRFCHADELLRQGVEAHLRAEEALQPDAVFAEIVHLPEGRVGNILARPVLREYEIPYLGRSGARADQQIPVRDLQLSVRGGKIRLRSARLGREVVPRLTTAHNFDRVNLPVYRFLSRLGGQGVAAGLSWQWGPIEGASFLPRVRCGRLVLSLACWRLERDELKRLGELQGAALFRAVQEWRSRRQLPRLVQLVDGDNTLTVDLENLLSIEAFVPLVKARSEARLQELFPDPDELVARGPEGGFVHELVIPLVKEGTEPAGEGESRQRPSKSKSKSKSRSKSTTGPALTLTPTLTLTPSVRPVAPSLPRVFVPGSEWLDARLYTGKATADHVLGEVVEPLVRNAIGSGAADSWFFIRYGDPGWHLRVRLHGRPKSLFSKVLPELRGRVEPLLADGRLNGVKLATYEREVERYGGPDGIELAEQLFYHDSEAVLEMLPLLERGDAGLDERWRLALRGMDMLLEDLGFDLDARHALAQRSREQFMAEIRADARLKAQLGSKYRQERARLETLLDPAMDRDSPLRAGFAILRRRSEQLAPVIHELQARERAGRLTVPLAEMAWSFLHMHVNRLLRSSQRQQEAVLYEYLARLYESRRARLMRQTQPQGDARHQTPDTSKDARRQMPDASKDRSGPLATRDWRLATLGERQ
jgi:thiopeptide-type bacteriocin biosynthesis protein